VKLWAVGDLHLGYKRNREALEELAPRPDDWLILAGDVGEGEEQLELALDTLGPLFAQLLWVPGNHDLWTRPTSVTGKKRLAGEPLYRRLVEICRERGVLTPEDPYPVFPGARFDDGTEDGRAIRIALMFLLYDYTFVPEDVEPERAVEWAMETDILCADEVLLKPDPWPSREAWCAERCRLTEKKLEAATAEGEATILVNHWPLRYEHAVLPAVPRFKIWCGTRRSEEWPERFGALSVVYGHLHIPRTIEEGGVKFEEVSFGYPKNWERWGRTLEESLRRIL
jgi:predicted phosphodiesterase